MPSRQGRSEPPQLRCDIQRQEECVMQVVLVVRPAPSPSEDAQANRGGQAVCCGPGNSTQRAASTNGHWHSWGQHFERMANNRLQPTRLATL